MKTLASILAFYILLLTGVPCCTPDNCAKAVAKTAKSDSNKHSADTEKDCGNCCSPFFSCADCGGFIVQKKYSLELPVFELKERIYSLYKDCFYPDFIPSLWEPPRLV